MKKTVTAMIIFLVLGAIMPAQSSDDARQAAWDDLIVYFSDWPLETLNADSFLIQTGWRELAKDKLIGMAYQVQASVLILPDCTLKSTLKIQAMSDDGIASSLDRDDLEKAGRLIKAAKRALEAYDKIVTDLDGIEKKHRQPPADSGN